MLIDAVKLSAQHCAHPIQAKLKYATTKNFAGRVIEGYDPDVTDIALMTPKAAQALCDVQNFLIEKYNYGLLVYDAYRPRRAVLDFLEWAKVPVRDAYELERKAKHYPNIEKNQFFELDYLVEDSGHCYGNTVDVFLLDLKTNEKLDLGARYDFMDEISHSAQPAEKIGEIPYKNRQILRSAMERFGYQGCRSEFWHFTHGGIAGREVKKPLDVPITREKLISHSFKPEALDLVIKKLSEKIKLQGDTDGFTVQQKLELLHELSQFDFGRYLLQNSGINGYWTHYMLTHPWSGRGTKDHKLENFLLDRAPVMRATQERFEIFLTQNQQAVKNHAKLACIPSGLLGELLYLDYKNINDISLVGFDYDSETLSQAKHLAEQKSLAKFVSLIEQDAWELTSENEFDLISSNGLNIYEVDELKVQALYQKFYQALKSGGKLVTSFLTTPAEWDMTKINSVDLQLQKVLFVDIVSGKWQCFRSTVQTKQQLAQVGFRDITILPDSANIFPTVVAWKW